MEEIKTRFRADIEGLRAVAVLSVIGFHYEVPRMTGGFVGVDIFFVISGYLISQLLLKEISATKTLDFVRFYGRRAKRLLPASLFMTIATLLVGYMTLAPFEQIEVAKSAQASALYATNVWLLHRAMNYFSPESSLNPFLHTWSLSVEEQFYLVWPAFLLVASRFGRRALVVAMLLLTAGSFIGCLYLTYTKQAWAFYFSPARAWEFGAGALVAIGPAANWARKSGSGAIIGWAAFAALIISCFAINEFFSFPGVVAIIPVLATALLLLTGENAAGPSMLLTTAPFQFFGTRSYAMYLWHWPIAVLGSVFVSVNAATYSAFFVLTVVLASFSYSWLEHPIRASRWLAEGSVRAIGLGGALTVVGAVSGLLSLIIAHQAADPTQAKIISATSKFSVSNEAGCIVGFTTDKPLRCVFGAQNYRKTIVLFGDSHADQWTTALASIAEQHGWRLVTYLKASCSVAEIPVYNMRLRRLSPECAKWRQEAIAQIANDHPDAVLVAQFSGGYVKGPFTNLGSNAVDVDAWEDGVRTVLEELTTSSRNVVILRDNPTPYHPVGTCLARAEWRGLSFDACNRELVQTTSQPVLLAEQRAVASFDTARMIDLTPAICRDTICPAVRDGVVVYRDANHLTVDFTLVLKNELENSLAVGL